MDLCLKFSSCKLTLRFWIKLFVIFCTVFSCHCKIFKVGWISPDASSGRKINSYTSVSALKLALATVVTNPMILEGHSIEVKNFTTDCTSLGTMQAAMSAYSYNADVIIGPPCQEGMKMVAQLSSHWNLPVFSWYNPGMEFDSAKTYPTLIRMIPSLSDMGTALLHLLRQNKWTDFIFFHHDTGTWTLYEEAIRAKVVHTEVRMLNSHSVNSSMTDAYLVQMFKKIKNYSYVVVFACPFKDIRRYLLAAEKAGMAFGNYVFIQLDHELYSEKTLKSDVLSKKRWMRRNAKDQIAKRAYKSLIHILLDPMNDDAVPTYPLPRNRYTEFVQMAPGGSNMKIPGWSLPQGGPPDVYSLYLYDAVLMWSVLVEKLFKAGKNHKDGKLMAQEAKYFLADGASGFLSMNDNLDRLGKFFILYMEKSGDFKPSQILKFNSTDGYNIINLKPLKEQLRYHSGQAQSNLGAAALDPTGKVQLKIAGPSVVKPTTVSTKATTAAAATQAPPTKSLLPKQDAAYFQSTKAAAKTTAHSPEALINRLLAKVQALEKSIIEHEKHSHRHIPDHTHTPYPTRNLVTSTMATIIKAHNPHQHPIPAPYNPNNHVHATTDNSVHGHGKVGQTTYLNHPEFGTGQLHWHPEPNSHGLVKPGPGPAVGINQNQVPPTLGTSGAGKTTLTPVATPKAAPTTTAYVPMPTTKAPPPAAPVYSQDLGNMQMDEAMIDRISSRIVDHLTGSTSNTTNANQQEISIANNWIANGLEELPPSIILGIHALRDRRLYEMELQQRLNNQRNQHHNNNYQQNNNQASQTNAPVQQWQPPIYRDPFDALFGPGFWNTNHVW